MAARVEKNCFETGVDSYVTHVHNSGLMKLHSSLSCLGVERLQIVEEGDKKDGWISTALKICAVVLLAIPFTILHLILTVWDKVTCCCKKVDKNPGGPNPAGDAGDAGDAGGAGGAGEAGGARDPNKDA